MEQRGAQEVIRKRLEFANSRFKRKERKKRFYDSILLYFFPNYYKTEVVFNP